MSDRGQQLSHTETKIDNAPTLSNQLRRREWGIGDEFEFAHRTETRAEHARKRFEVQRTPP